MKKILLVTILCLVFLLLRGGTPSYAFECVGTENTDCLQCHSVQEGIHVPHWSRSIGAYPNCGVCHCGEEDTSQCDVSRANTRGPVETVCCTSCHDKCTEVSNHSSAYTSTTTVEPTTTAVTTTSSIDTTSTVPETSTTTSLETTTSTTVAATTTVVDPLSVCLPCHSDCENTTSIPVQRMHDGKCRKCHPSSELHAQQGHTTCAQCHRGGIPRAGNVNAASCVASCHPLANPGTCNLVNDHDPARETDCLNCHQECVETTTTTSLPDCDIMITPAVDKVYSEQTVQYAAHTTGVGCLNGAYQWHLDSPLNSQLDAAGRYTAGYNNTGQPVTDIIIIEDTANHIRTEWPVMVRFEKITRIVPDSLLRSQWFMLPQVVMIEGEGTHFNNQSTVLMFYPPASVIPSWQTVVNETLIGTFILVMPAWYAGQNDEQVMLMVMTGDETLTAQILIDQFPVHRGIRE